jgi:hypothetical protein
MYEIMAGQSMRKEPDSDSFKKLYKVGNGLPGHTNGSKKATLSNVVLMSCLCQHRR